MPVSDFFSLRLPFLTPGGPFSSLSVGKASISAPNSLIRSLICEPSVPTGYSTLDRSAYTGFRILRMPVSLPDPRRTVFEPMGGKANISAQNSLTGGPICKPSIPIGYSTLKRSARAGFGFFRSSVPLPNPRRAVFEPNCRKTIDFRSKFHNRESYLGADRSYKLLYPQK